MIFDRSIRQLVFTGHAVRQMFARRIFPDEVKALIADHEVVAAYPEDTPYPSWLLFGMVEGRPLHAVLAYDREGQTAHVITAYEPDLTVWKQDYKTRRKP